MPIPHDSDLAYLSATAFGLPDDVKEPPAEFRLISYGEIQTDKGPFLFDDQAATTVMSLWKEKGKTLMADWEHQSLVDPPIRAPASCKQWVPEVRADGLYVTQAVWTALGAEDIRGGYYRFFSPAFRFDEKTRRVKEIVNFALTNNPATWGLSPLLAASSTATTNEEDQPMECKDCAALTAKIGEQTARLSAFETKDEAKKEELTALSTFRTEVLAATGQTNAAGALGALAALAQANKDLAAEREKQAKEKTAALSTQFKTLLDSGVKDGKITPAGRPYWERTLNEDGPERGVARLSGFLETAGVTGGTPVTQPAAGITVTAEQAQIMRNMGQTPDRLAKYGARS